LPLPVLYYTPETSIAGGALLMHYFHDSPDPRGRGSNLQLVGVYTAHSQAIGNLSGDLYLLDDAYHAAFLLIASDYPDLFWGIGNKTPDANKESFTARTAAAIVTLQRRVGASVYVGVRGYVAARDIRDTSPGLLLSGSVVGAGGGRISGLGPALTLDTRDNVYAPLRGSYLDASYQAFGTAFGSQYTFGRYVIDAREYVPIVRSHVLAIQAYGTFIAYSPPFLEEALIGGPFTMRGYYQGRYRDHQMVEAQAEYRFPVVWRFGAVVFAAAGEVAHSVSDFNLTGTHFAVGAGIRFAAVPKERINIRFDVGYAEGAVSPYLYIGEAF